MFHIDGGIVQRDRNRPAHRETQANRATPSGGKHTMRKHESVNGKSQFRFVIIGRPRKKGFARSTKKPRIGAAGTTTAFLLRK